VLDSHFTWSHFPEQVNSTYDFHLNSTNITFIFLTFP
jgi:hypothetical protein